MAGNLNFSLQIGAQVDGTNEVKKLTDALNTFTRLANEANARAGQNFGAGISSGAKTAATSLNSMQSAANSAQKAVANLGVTGKGSVDGLSVGFGGLLKQVAALAALAGAGKLFGDFIADGIKLNKTLEDGRIGIAAIIAASADLKDGYTGKLLEGQQAYNAALGLSEDLMLKLRKAGLETAATTEQLTTALQANVGPGLAAGLNLDGILKTTIDITQAATALGLPFDQLAQETRAILSGDIDRNARIAQTLGITNEMVKKAKEQGTLQEFLNNKLASFSIAAKDAAKNFSTIASNAQEASSVLASNITAPLFDSLKSGLSEFQNRLLDTKTLGIAKPFEDAAGFAREIAGVVGTELDRAITAVLDKVQELSGFIKDNKPQIDELTNSFRLLYEQLLDILKNVGLLGEAIGSAGVKSSAFAIIIQTIAVLLAGIKDGFTVIGSAIIYLGGNVVEFFLKPLVLAAEVAGKIANTLTKGSGDALLAVADKLKGVSQSFKDVAENMIEPIANNNGAVGKAIKNIQDYEKALAAATSDGKKVKASGADPADFAALDSRIDPTLGVRNRQQTEQELKAAQALADRIAKVRLALAQASAKAQEEAQKAAFDAEGKQLDDWLAQSLISYENYYKARQDLIERQSTAEQNVTLKQIDNANKALAKTSDPVDKIKIQTQLVTLQGQLNAEIAKEGAALTDNNTKREAALKAGKAQLDNLQATVAEQTGNQAEADRIRIEAQYQDYIEFANRLAGANREAALAFAEGYKANATVISAIQQEQQRQQTANALAASEQELELAKINQAYQNGDITFFEAQSRKKQLIQDQIDQQEILLEKLDEELKKQQQLRNTDTVAKIQTQINGVKTNLVALKGEVADNAYVNTFADGIASALDQVLNKTASVGDAIRSTFATIFRGIADELTKLLIRKAALSVVEYAGGAATGGYISPGGSILRRAVGGPVYGPGTETSDSILARLSKGEFVIRAAAVRHWGVNFMHEINNMGQRKLPGFAEGGAVSNNIDLSSIQPASMKQSIKIVNVTDPKELENALATTAGERAVLNVLQRNPKAIQSLAQGR